MSLPPDTVIYLPSHPVPPPGAAHALGSDGEIGLPALPPLFSGDVGTIKREVAAESMSAVDGEAMATATMLMDWEAQGREAQGHEAAADSMSTPKKRNRISVLTPHEALSLFAHKGVYVDEETGELRVSTNHKPCGKWDLHRYNRHFALKCFKKYETERLDPTEVQRLTDAKERYFRMNPIVEEASLFRKRRKLMEGEKMLSVDELRVHEKHWMEMWKAAKNELRQLREDLKVEMDEEVRAELMADIEGLKKRKGDWARLLGLDAPPAHLSATF